ncbi:serine hydrolase [Marinoscillum furvescens]|uniref:Beta-lactamase family protein n=1 Tax=Marinoscillum furvescens DSM 4134 TaxID=1122208 RepID=A0A3D9KZH2_MARFU|nr:serine hydrolase [Marinoscillum furvescens]RED93656.1 beta-lactamase family protein [Marinoscillum furvescens DSM 4134]
MRYLIQGVFLVTAFTTFGQNSLVAIFDRGSEEFKAVLADPRYEVQVIYGQVSGDAIIHHTIGVDSSRYFYPASSVKMLTAIAAVQRLNEMGWPLSTQIQLDSTDIHPRFLTHDQLFDGPITVEHLIKKIFTYSDNQAYNVLFGWLGREYIAGVFEEVGLPVRITHQLGESAFAFPPEANANSQVVKLINPKTSAELSLQSAPQKVRWAGDVTEQVKGVGYLRRGTVVDEPFDFSGKNFAPLTSLLGAMERIQYPEAFSPEERFKLTDTLRKELIEIMDLYPSDMPPPIDSLADNYVKFFLYGDQDQAEIPDYLHIHNKVGWAYGYLTDVAYIQDERAGVSFFLAATIHVNANQIYNDGVYEYKEVGLPFLAELGRLIHSYEIGQ